MFNEVIKYTNSKENDVDLIAVTGLIKEGVLDENSYRLDIDTTVEYYQKHSIDILDLISSFRLIDIKKSETGISSDLNDPIITSINKKRFSVGETVVLGGSNFTGFESDVIVIIEDVNGKSAMYNLGYDKQSANDGFAEFVLRDEYCLKDHSYSGLPCEEYLEIIPGIYHMYMQAWSKKSSRIQIQVVE
jgi:hypothetical protein